MMTLGTTFQISVVLHGIILCYGAEAQPPNNWDYLIFTQEWPQSACIAYKGDNSQRACAIFSNVTAWTVHGIWPTKAGTKGPHNCQDLQFDLEKLRKIEPNLLQSWPNIYAGKSVYSLWKHEWQKHGTCATELPSIGDEREYFALGLRWSSQYQPLPVLAAAGVRPGGTGYRWTQIRDALTARFSTRMIVDCEMDRESRLWYLSQIKLCLDKSYVPTDCHNKTNQISTGCPDDGILYPPIIPTPTPVLRHDSESEPELEPESESESVPVKEELLEIVQVELMKNEVELPAKQHWYRYRYWYGLDGRL